MKTSRRGFLHYSFGLTTASMFPAIWHRNRSTGYTVSETEQRIRQGENLTKHDLATPALLLDLDIFEANLEKMSSHAQNASIHLRPHSKTHKCVEIAKRQVQAGALGVCAATISEAEAMAEGGLQGILITCE